MTRVNPRKYLHRTKHSLFLSKHIIFLSPPTSFIGTDSAAPIIIGSHHINNKLGHNDHGRVAVDEEREFFFVWGWILPLLNPDSIINLIWFIHTRQDVP